MAKDRKDKVLSRIHKKRIELDFRDRPSHLNDSAILCCQHCARLFSGKVHAFTLFVGIYCSVRAGGALEGGKGERESKYHARCSAAVAAGVSATWAGKQPRLIRFL